MNRFDLSILTYLNSFSNLYPHMDVLITHVEQDNLLKGGVLVTMCWYFWFQGPDEKAQTIIREKLLAGLMAMVAGLFIARSLTHLLPFRVRPFSNPELHFVTPNLIGNTPMAPDWSAFPSDHAVVWFSVAAAIYLINKPIGWLTITYVSFLSLGRIYTGYHHPTDILAGGALGIALLQIFNSRRAREHVTSPILSWSKTRPGPFYAIAFLCTYEISNMFNEVRAIGELAWHAVKLSL